MEGIINWLEQHLLPCMYKALFGIDCPGCGGQTSFIALLRGEFMESLQIYPPLIPNLVLIAFLILHLIFKFQKGALILRILFIFNVLIIVANYIYKFSPCAC